MPRESVQSLERALGLLQVLGSAERPTGVTELARGRRLAKSTVHRLLSTLERTGFVARTEDARYRLGLKLWEMGCAAVRSLTVREVARPVMEELVRRTGETVHLSVWDNGEVVYIDKVDGTNPIRLHSSIGGRAPGHATASGLALLAFQDAAIQAEVWRHGLRRYTHRTITEPGRFRRKLEAVRRQGFAFSADAWHRGSSGVAAPIRGHDGKVVAALSVAGPGERIVGRSTELSHLVRTAADEISRVLGDPTVRWAPPASPTLGKRKRRGPRTAKLFGLPRG